MPKGVYHHKKMKDRSPEVQRIMQRCLGIGRTDPEVRKRSLAGIRANAKRPEFISKMRDIRLGQISDPLKYKRWKTGLSKWIKNNENNFYGGNGQWPTNFILKRQRELAPLGFVREFVIKTRGHRTKHNPPFNYKADFANPKTKVVIEFDGISHRRKAEIDKKKTEVLESLGWKVIRIKHD